MTPVAVGRQEARPSSASEGGSPLTTWISDFRKTLEDAYARGIAMGEEELAIELALAMESAREVHTPLEIEEVTSEALIDFLGYRLGELDDSITREIAAIESQGETSKSISMRRELLDAIGGEIRLETNDPKKKVDLASIQVIWDGARMTATEALNAAGLHREISFTGADELGRATEGSKMSLEMLEAGSGKLEKEQRRMTSDNDLRMLRLQDMMNRRSQVIQMVSNFLRSIQDAQRAIVGNLR